MTKETPFGNHPVNIKALDGIRGGAIYAVDRTLRYHLCPHASEGSHGPGVNPLLRSEDRVICRAKGSLSLFPAGLFLEVLPRLPRELCSLLVVALGVLCPLPSFVWPPCGPCWAPLVAAGDCLFLSASQNPQPCL